MFSWSLTMSWHNSVIRWQGLIDTYSKSVPVREMCCKWGLIQGANHIRADRNTLRKQTHGEPWAASVYACICTHTCSADSDTETQSTSNVAVWVRVCTKYLHSRTHSHCLECQRPCAPTSQTLIYPCQSGSLPNIQLTSSEPHLPPPGRWKWNVAVGLGQPGPV